MVKLGSLGVWLVCVHFEGYGQRQCVRQSREEHVSLTLRSQPSWLVLQAFLGRFIQAFFSPAICVRKGEIKLELLEGMRE